ncbi:hypothetical protein C8J28_1083 [Cereibacter azotoformans]|uniref:Uncharacterized protein n=1 Tax=Cereibacter azotoformans TaxID=43057 RepID=A0A2T5K780_9RHOB|nr:hypothetical protein C8J28_1083 [Cereibacter azotoformans]
MRRSGASEGPARGVEAGEGLVMGEREVVLGDRPHEGQVRSGRPRRWPRCRRRRRRRSRSPRRAPCCRRSSPRRTGSEATAGTTSAPAAPVPLPPPAPSPCAAAACAASTAAARVTAASALAKAASAAAKAAVSVSRAAASGVSAASSAPMRAATAAIVSAAAFRARRRSSRFCRAMGSSLGRAASAQPNGPATGGGWEWVKGRVETGSGPAAAGGSAQVRGGSGADRLRRMAEERDDLARRATSFRAHGRR